MVRRRSHREWSRARRGRFLWGVFFFKVRAVLRHHQVRPVLRHLCASSLALLFDHRPLVLQRRAHGKARVVVGPAGAGRF